MTETTTSTCAACKFFAPKADAGECRRHAPQTIVFEVDDIDTIESRFPTVQSSDWCGDFEAK